MGAFATVAFMASAPDQQYRRDRLDELAKHPDFLGRASLGRALGYKDGAFVRQMIVGERPITEKTVAFIETMRGGKYRGWFERPGLNLSVIEEPASTPYSAEPPAPPADFSDRRTHTDSEWAILQDLRALPEVDREELRAELHAKAEKYRAYAREIIGRVNGKKTKT